MREPGLPFRGGGGEQPGPEVVERGGHLQHVGAAHPVVRHGDDQVETPRAGLRILHVDDLRRRPRPALQGQRLVQDQAGARSPHRVAEGDRAAVGVDDVGLDAEVVG